MPAGHARHRHWRHRREGGRAGQRGPDGAYRHPGADRPRPRNHRREAARRALWQGQQARYRRPGPWRPHDRAGCEGQIRSDPRRLQAGGDDPQLRGHPSRTLRARWFRPGRTDPAETGRLARDHPRGGRQRTPRQRRWHHQGRARQLEERRYRVAVGQDPHRSWRRPQAHRRHAEKGWRAAGRGRFHQPLHLLRRPGRCGAWRSGRPRRPHHLYPDGQVHRHDAGWNRPYRHDRQVRARPENRREHQATPGRLSDGRRRRRLSGGQGHQEGSRGRLCRSRHGGHLRVWSGRYAGDCGSRLPG